jgi:hypothetical protein
VAVVSFVGVQIEPRRREEVRRPCAEMVQNDLPSASETYLLAADA